MPFPYANYFVGFVLLVIVAGFWDSYFLPVMEVPAAFHVHAFSAMAWLVLLMLQVWSIHHRRNALHKRLGLLSLALFPALILGLVMIANGSAARFVADGGPDPESIAPSIGMVAAFSIVAYLVLFYQALRHRRNVRLHAAYMLSTPLVLWESPFSRIMLSDMQFLIFTQTERPQMILDSIVISIGMAILFALVMYLLDRKNGSPFLVAAGLMAIQAIATYIGSDIGWIRTGYAAYAHIPDWITLLIALGLGAGVSWLGWANRSGRQASGKGAMATP